jgi:arsenite methyltransferase
LAVNPHSGFHFHTGRAHAARLGYDEILTASLPDSAVESFAGVANPFSLRSLSGGERVVDLGSGGGFDCFVAARQVGPKGHVVGVDMTPEMLVKARIASGELGMENVELREGMMEDLPVEDGWAEVVIGNGSINQCPDKRRVFSEIRRVLRPGGRLQFADIVNGKPVSEAAIRIIALWMDRIAGSLPYAGWERMLEDAGFADIEIGAAVDTFGEAKGEKNARVFDVRGYPFLAVKPR